MRARGQAVKSLLVAGVGVSALLGASAGADPYVVDRDAPVTTRPDATRLRDEPLPATAAFWEDYVEGESYGDWRLRKVFVDQTRALRSSEQTAQPFYNVAVKSDDAQDMNAVIDRITQQLVSGSPAELSGARVVVSDCPGATAYHLRTGEITLCQELLLAPTYEEELAFVISHELAHRRLDHYRLDRAMRRKKIDVLADSYGSTTASVYANGFAWGSLAVWYFASTRPEKHYVTSRDPIGRTVTTEVKQSRQEQIADSLTTFSGLTSIVFSALAVNGLAQQVTNRVSDYRLWRLNSTYVRERVRQEREADQFAVRLMSASGYNPDSAQTLFYALAEAETGETVQGGGETRAERGFGRVREARHWDATQRRDDLVAAAARELARLDYPAPRALPWTAVDVEPNAPDLALGAAPSGEHGESAASRRLFAAILGGTQARESLEAAVVARREGASLRFEAACDEGEAMIQPLVSVYPNNGAFLRMALAIASVCGPGLVIDVQRASRAEFGEIADLDVKFELLSYARLTGGETLGLARSIAAGASTDLQDNMRIRVQVIEEFAQDPVLAAQCRRRFDGVGEAVFWNMPHALRWAAGNWNLRETGFLNDERVVREFCEARRGVARALADSERDRLKTWRRRAADSSLAPFAGDLLYVRDALSRARN